MPLVHIISDMPSTSCLTPPQVTACLYQVSTRFHPSVERQPVFQHLYSPFKCTQPSGKRTQGLFQYRDCPVKRTLNEIPSKFKAWSPSDIVKSMHAGLKSLLERIRSA